MTISEKVAYLKGLAEGLNLDTEKSKEGKLISVMIGILEEIGLSIEDLEENTQALGEEIDVLSDDLSDVEDVVFDEDEDEDEDDYDFDDDDEELDDEELYEVTCPSCGDTICITEDMLDEGSVNCPNCGELLEFDFDDECDCDDEGCGCGCGHDHE